MRRPRNPLGKPTKDFVVVTKEKRPWTYVYILDLGPPVDPGYVEPDQIGVDLVGGVILLADVEEPRDWDQMTHRAAAAKGYGPLVYETAASIVGEPLSPSSAQSGHAQRLWGRYGGHIFPLDPDEFKDKYGVSLRRMVRQGRKLQLGPSDWEEMEDRVSEVAYESWSASESMDPTDYDPLHYQGSEKYQRAMAVRNPRRRR